MALEQAILLGARAQIKNQELELILNLEQSRSYTHFRGSSRSLPRY